MTVYQRREVTFWNDPGIEPGSSRSSSDRTNHQIMASRDKDTMLSKLFFTIHVLRVLDGDRHVVIDEGDQEPDVADGVDELLEVGHVRLEGVVSTVVVVRNRYEGKIRTNEANLSSEEFKLDCSRRGGGWDRDRDRRSERSFRFGRSSFSPTTTTMTTSVVVVVVVVVPEASSSTT